MLTTEERYALQGAAMVAYRASNLATMSTEALAQLAQDLELTADNGAEIWEARTVLARVLVTRPKDERRAATKAARHARGLV